METYNDPLFYSKTIKGDSTVLEDCIISNPLPLQYLGSKTRISRWIVDNISKQVPEVSTFVDLFAGTGAVSLEAFEQGYDVILNDIQPYSYAILKSIFITPKIGLGNIVTDLILLKKQSELLSGQRNFLKDFLKKETDIIKSFEEKK